MSDNVASFIAVTRRRLAKIDGDISLLEEKLEEIESNVKILMTNPKPPKKSKSDDDESEKDDSII